ncbi:hypothetical protein Glove_417g22 [Diversispora epigaea]|uniref:Uncharacterized protein n=1 Tax=Diversispora epigaea TaxID=1348612 RepID=A0A397H0U1_9GLOM|nr:hypothetical protein Glove_417g22 [Diversispora epigaea]
MQQEFSQVIEDSKNKLTPCILMDIVDDKFQTCGADSKKRLCELIGHWQIDKDIVNQVNNDLFRLGVWKSCKQHSSNILNRVILIPCIGQINCKALKKCDNICKEASENAYRPLFICGKCFINNGGHLYIKPGKGKKPSNCDGQHVNDSSEQLKMIGQWLITIGKSNENKLQNLTLFTIAPSIFQILENISLKKCPSIQ